MADKKPLAQYSGKLKEFTATDKIPVINLATGTPDGTKFIRDDGTLATPTVVQTDSSSNRLFMYYNFI